MRQLTLGIIALLLFATVIAIADHVENGVSVTDYNRVAGNSVGKNWSNNGYTIVNGSLSNVTCYQNCTGFATGNITYSVNTTGYDLTNATNFTNGIFNSSLLNTSIRVNWTVEQAFRTGLFWGNSTGTGASHLVNNGTQIQFDWDASPPTGHVRGYNFSGNYYTPLLLSGNPVVIGQGILHTVNSLIVEGAASVLYRPVNNATQVSEEGTFGQIRAYNFTGSYYQPLYLLGNGVIIQQGNLTISPPANPSCIQMKSPDGTSYRFTIANGGTTSVVAGTC